MSDTNEPESEVLDFEETKAVSVKQPEAVKSPVMVAQGAIQAMTPQELATYCVLNDKVELFERVMEMSRQQEAREAEKEFYVHFAKMQQDYVPVQKGRDGQFGPYANINDILAVYGPILARHGFSYTFDEEELSGKLGWKRVWSYVTGYGHTKKTYFDCPPPAENKGSSAIQKEAGNTTYGKRQAFNSNVGVVLQDEDKDGDFPFDMGVEYSEEIKLLRESKTVHELYANYKTVLQNKNEAAKKMFFDIRFKLENEIRKAGA